MFKAPQTSLLPQAKCTYAASVIFAHHSRGKAIKKILRDIYLRFFKPNPTAESHRVNIFMRENKYIRPVR